MAKKIIILEKRERSVFNVAFWLDVPTARQAFYADDTKSSAYADATAEELTAIRLGQVYEHVDSIETRGQTQAQIRSTLQEMHANMQVELDQRDTWVRYGSFWDGTAWTNNGVP